MALDQEYAAFQRELPRLLADPRTAGGYALFHGDSLIGVYRTEEMAIKAGYDRFGFDPILVKQILEKEPYIYVSRNIRTCQS